MYKLMIVDDRDIVLRQIKRMKLWNGETSFKIAAEAGNGHDALKILQTEQMDLVITDIKMPKVNGIELLKEIKEKGLCPCVVLLSDYADFAHARQGIQYGAFDYLSKPADENELQDLLQRVDQFLRKKRQEMELVRNLEEKLEEKIVSLYPAAELEQLFEFLKNRKPEAFDMAERFTVICTRLFENELVKLAAALKRAMAEMVQKLRESYGWLDKFVDLDAYKGLDFSAMESSAAAADAFLKAVRETFDKIYLLEYGDNQEKLENKISRYVLERVDETVSIEGIAQAMFMNRKYLSELFRQRTGELLVEYITRVKLDRAARLLLQSGMKAYEIAIMLGYKDTEYFSRLFKKHTGMSPTEYRNSVDDQTKTDIIPGKN